MPASFAQKLVDTRAGRRGPRPWPGTEEASVLERTPNRTGQVVLAVRDLDAMAGFYQRVVGLDRLGRDGGGLNLGAGGHVLLTLRPGATSPEAPADAGLYHAAFLLPRRADLGAFVAHLRGRDVPVLGIVDHVVNDAVYLSDPEGNGVEVYADRPASGWHREGRFPPMGRAPIDVAGLMAAATERWSGMPDGGCVGHVHLRVGDVPTADGFYARLLGLDVNPVAPTAHFYSTGGYHHQVAANVWHSAGAPPRRAGTTGLLEMQLVYREDATFKDLRARLAALGAAVRADGSDLIVADPWGIDVRLTPPERQDLP